MSEVDSLKSDLPLMQTDATAPLKVTIRPEKATVLAWRDVWNGISDWRLAYNFAIEDLKGKFHRTLIGPLWIAGSFLAFIVVKIFIFSSLNDAKWEYFASYLTLGYMTWTFITSTINGGSTSLLSARNWILGMKCNYSTFILQSMFNSLVTVVITAIAALIVSYYVYPYSVMSLLWSIIGFISIVPLLLCVQLILSVLCVFFRDLVQLISAVMRIMFFLTPIIWLPSMLGAKAEVLKYNPFTHLLAVVRQPLLSEPVPNESWFWILGLTIAAMLISAILYPVAINKIARHI